MSDLKATDSESGLDTSPLDPDQLSVSEWGILKGLERRLNGVRTSKYGRSLALGSDGSLASAEDRYSRVILLDGARGTGKTSLLLTFVRMWHYAAGVQDSKAAPAPAEYAARVTRLRKKHGLAAAPTYVRVMPILDFDPLPPEMPLVAGIVQAWRALAQSYDDLGGYSPDCDDETKTLLMDSWHRLFQVAAVGWAAIPRNKGLIEQVLDREEQVEDWHRLDRRWRDFIDEVLERGRKLQRLPPDAVFVIMIDDVDLQVGRIRELLPALRLLYHPRVAFLIAADRRHMIDMLKLDFLGQQNRLANRQLSEDSLQVSERDRWATELARSSFQKVFPLKNREQLRQLSVLDLLGFPVTVPGKKTANLGAILDELQQERRAPRLFGPVGEYLKRMAGSADDPIDLPPIMAYRTAHQIGQQVSTRYAARESALDALRQVIGGPATDDLVRITKRRGRAPAVEYRVSGTLVALFREETREPTGDFSGIVLSAQPDFVYQASAPGERTPITGSGENAMVSALVAVSLRDDGYPIVSPGLRWDVRLALAWTSARLFDRTQPDVSVDVSFQWPLYQHPSPMRLMGWAKEWAEFVHGLSDNATDPLDRIAYAWIYYQLRWMSEDGSSRIGARLPGPFDERFNSDRSWRNLLSQEPETGTQKERKRWRTRTLPLLARPEIGLTERTQSLLLEGVTERSDVEWLWAQRRRFVTDAIITAADESGVTPKNAEEQSRVESALSIVELRHRNDLASKSSPWFRKIEKPRQRQPRPARHSK